MPLAALPNLLSGLRILLVLPFSVLLLREQFAPALALFIAAAVTDGIDGWLARRFNWQSQLGALLDPAADKLLIAVSLILLAWMTLAPVWVVAVVLVRDIVIVLGALAYRSLIGPLTYGASRLSKLCTALQLLLIVALLLQPLQVADLASTGQASTGQASGGHASAASALMTEVIAWLAVAVAALAVLSGADYVHTWARKAAVHRAQAGR